jgi:3',5'-cyclic AMP phosphodiesterase CpdA
MTTVTNTVCPIANASKEMETHTPFRIVHLSDLHLTSSDKASRSETKLFCPLKGMNEAFREIVKAPVVQSASLVLITGDVTDRGDIQSWQVFWEAIDAVCLRDRIVVVPGNHDVCCLGLRIPPRRKGYDSSDLRKAQEGLRLGGQPEVFPWARMVDPRVAVFALNSNNLGNVGITDNAMGLLEYHQLAKLARDLRKYQAAPVKIVVLHHSPNIPGDDTAKKRGMKRLSWLETKGLQIPRDMRRALRLLCIAHDVRLVLHGHLHRSEDRRVDSIRMVGVRATTEPIESNSDQNTYEVKVYTVRGAGGRVDRKDHRIVYWKKGLKGSKE